MRVSTLSWDTSSARFAEGGLNDASFALYFGPNETIENPVFQAALRKVCPDARLIGCTTGSLIAGADVKDGAAGAVAVRLEKTSVRLVSNSVSFDGSFDAGRQLAERLAAPDLSGVLVLCDSMNVDGMKLVEGMREALGTSVPVSGGLASDGTDFLRTVIGADGPPQENQVAALGFYGAAFRMQQGCAHGWDDFGPPRRITKASGNVLFELDGKPALDLYEGYLGAEAQELPGAALRFPLLVSDPNDPSKEVIRTVLDIDRQARTLHFASTLHEGWVARLMRGSFSRLAEGAREAASQVSVSSSAGEAGLALLVSCVGRRVVMGQYTVDETEAVGSILMPNYTQIGFYSHGEISSAGGEEFCGLHNQTMTIMAISEAA